MLIPGLMRASKILAVLLVALTVGGCLTQGARFVPIQGIAGEAIVYVYRESGVIGHGLDLEVFANRESIARLQVGTYEALHLPPGRYKFTAEPHQTKQVALSGITASGIHGNTLLTLEIDQGYTYYLKLEEGLGSLLIESVPATTATPVLAKMKQAGTG